METEGILAGGTLKQSLPLLQSRIKADPESFCEEYRRQFLHFESLLERHKLRPHIEDEELEDISIFLAATSPCFYGMSDSFASHVIFLLSRPDIELMHFSTRRVLVKALFVLRNHAAVPLLTIDPVTKFPAGLLPLCYKLYQLKDREMKKKIYGHVVTDVLRMRGTVALGRKKIPTDPEGCHQAYNFITKNLETSEIHDESMLSISLLIDFYRRKAYEDAPTANCIAASCYHSNPKVCQVAAQFMLGSKVRGHEIVESDDENSDVEKLTSAVTRGIVGSKKTAGRKRKLTKDKKKLKKREEGRNEKLLSGYDVRRSVTAIDHLRDPDSFAVNVLRRTHGHDLTFGRKLVAWDLCSRVISRRRLCCPRFFQRLNTYLNPKQSRVTELLCYVAQGVHDETPPSVLEEPVGLIMRKFASEDQPAEVVAVGVNTLREIALRNPEALAPEQVEQILDLFSIREKSVNMAIRSIVNVYREKDVLRLPKKFRGREASIALSIATKTGISPDLMKEMSSRLLTEEDFRNLKRKRKALAEEAADKSPPKKEKETPEVVEEEVEDEDDEDDGLMELLEEGSDKEKEEVNGEVNSRPKKKRKLDVEETEDTDSSDESEDDEFSRWKVDQNRLLGYKEKRSKRKSQVEEEKKKDKAIPSFGPKAARFLESRKSLPTKVQSRKKVFAMTAAGKKTNFLKSAKQKMSELRKHVKTIKQDRGGKKKFRKS